MLSFEATERAGPEIARPGLAENLSLIDEAAKGAYGPLVGGLMCWHTTFGCSDDCITEAFAAPSSSTRSASRILR